jgi:hypothetical protein
VASDPSWGDPGSLRPHLNQVTQFAVFVSYGDEAKDFKKRVKRLVEEAVSRQLNLGVWPIDLVVWDWRDMAGERAPEDGKTNDLFVRKARESSVTMVLLRDKMPPGSEEELLAVVKDPEIDLKVFWLNEDPSSESEVGRFLREHSDAFRYVELLELDSEDSWITLTANVVAVLLRALRGQDRRPFWETRDAA